MTINLSNISTDSANLSIDPLLTVGYGSNLVGNLDIGGGQIVNPTVPGSYPYQVLISDSVILASSSSAHTVTLIASPPKGSVLIVQDVTGTASTNTITIDGNGKNINGSSTASITQNYAGFKLYYTGTQWLASLVSDIPSTLPVLVNVTGTSQAMAINTGYIANNSSLVTFTLPTSAPIGSVVKVVGAGSGGWTITYTTSQIIHFGNVNTTVTTGSLSSSNRYDAIELACTATTNEWTCTGEAQGNITVV